MMAARPTLLLSLLADHLTRHGIAVLRFDNRGIDQSEGNTALTIAEQRVGNSQAALNYLRTWPEVDLLHLLGLSGPSEGASVALLAAASRFGSKPGGYGQPGPATLPAQQAAALRAQKSPPAELDIRQRRQTALAERVRYSTNLGQTQAVIARLLSQDEPGLAPVLFSLQSLGRPRSGAGTRAAAEWPRR